MQHDYFENVQRFLLKEFLFPPNNVKILRSEIDIISVVAAKNVSMYSSTKHQNPQGQKPINLIFAFSYFWNCKSVLTYTCQWGDGLHPLDLMAFFFFTTMPSQLLHDQMSSNSPWWKRTEGYSIQYENISKCFQIEIFRPKMSLSNVS